METDKKYSLILSTDGKCSLIINAENHVELEKAFDAATPVFKKAYELGKTTIIASPRGGGGFPPKPAPEVVPDRKCPKCGNPLVKVKTSKGEAIKCSTQKYDWKTKTASGCTYIEWLEPKTTPENL